MSVIVDERVCSMLIEKRLHSSDFDCLNIDVQVPEKRCGFMGDHFKIVLDVINKKQTEKIERQSLTFFAKGKPELAIQRKVVESLLCFVKEDNFFQTLAPVYESIFPDRKLFPAWFYSESDFLIMEDLSMLGYKPLENIRKPLDLKHCKQVINALACFHAAHFIAENKLGQRLSDYCPKEIQVSTFRETGDMWSDWYATMIRAAVDLVPFMPKYKGNTVLVNAVQERLPGLFKEFFSLYAVDPSTRNVLSHGDVWAANVMFKYNHNGEPEQALFVDFQTVLMAPPTSDLMMFLHLTTRRAFREQHLEDLQLFYYENLSDALRLHGIKVADILTREEFLLSCKKYIRLGRIVTAYYFQVTHYPPDRMAELMADPELFSRYFYSDRTDRLIDAFETVPEYRELMNEVYEDLIDLLELTADAVGRAENKN